MTLDTIIMSKSKSCMSENLTSDHIENDEFYLNSEQNDYAKLISKLKEIKKTIALLEKTISM